MNDKLTIVGALICIGGIIPIIYLASIFGSELPGWALLVPILTGCSFMIYSLIPSVNERQNLREDKHV